MLRLKGLVSVLLVGMGIGIEINPAQAQSRVSAVAPTTVQITVNSTKAVNISGRVTVVVKQGIPVAFNIYRGMVAGVKVKFDSLLINQTSCIFTEAPDQQGNLITGIPIFYATPDTNIVKITQNNDTTVNLLKLPFGINCP